MDKTKIWWQSRAVWGSVVTIAAGVGAVFGLTIEEQIQADVADWLVALAALIGGAVALWGRLKASKMIAPDK